MRIANWEIESRFEVNFCRSVDYFMPPGPTYVTDRR